ncbi:MAG: membrane-bound lytic murein transglycosylase MltF [Porticoccaceae bacterium]
MRELTNRERKLRNRIVLILFMLPFISLISASTHLNDLAKVKAKGQLVMLTLPGPTTYFEDGHGKNGFDYLLAKAFADSLGVELVVRTKSTLRRLLYSIGNPQGDFAAANLVKTAARNQSLVFSMPYLEVTQQLIYHRGSKRPRSLHNFEEEVVVIAGSSHSEHLRTLKNQYPNLSWREQDSGEMSDLVRRVHEGEISYSVVDSIAFLINRHIYPRARKALDISDPQSMAWAFPAHHDGTLLRAANEFLDQYIASGELESLTSQLLAQTENFSVSNSQRLGKLVAERLPSYEPLFRETAANHDMDWHLLAAVAYQESHWDPRAKSPTGVRGLMMLTLNTASEMKVTNRLDAAQSLKGGAAYLMKLKARLPRRIEDPDRTLFALAAYNVGFGHLEDARILTERHGKNPDSWADVREHLPLLSKKEHYSTLKHGYARGNEPVLYVDNIQYYKTYLQLHSLSQQDFLPEPEPQPEPQDWEINALPSI